ncbi:MAG TPA: mycofactocin biosynthesis glycosyltransferase MftF [Acidimicrobiales bacterium]
MRLALDRTSRRLDGGRLLVAGSPLTAFRLGAAGGRAVDAVAASEDLGSAAQPLLDRLLDTGAAHPRPAGGRFGPQDVTVVIPVRDHDPGATLASLGPVAAVVVVDDGSVRPVVAPGARVVRHDRSRGPAAARTTGAAGVTTPLLAFVDADCVPTAGWLDPLLAHFDDERVALAAPRVVSQAADAATVTGVIARYEASRSPLDLGSEEGRIAPATRISYAPAAAVLVRRRALEEVGGFDASLQVGEDVDLVWRLVEAGWRARYEPRSVVGHRPRATVGGFARQRFGYGSSAGALERRHPGAVAPVVTGPAAAGGWALAAAGHPIAGALLGLAPAVTVRRALPDVEGRDALALRLAALGLLRAGEQLASAVSRIWWPVALPAVLGVRRLRRPVLAAALVPVVIDWWRTVGGPPPARLDPVRYLGLRLVDDAAYGAGVWVGAWRARTPGVLLPRITPRPRWAGQGRRATISCGPVCGR